MSVQLYKHDLPDGLDLGSSIAIDTETMGLNLQRDRLCLVQLCAGDGAAHLVQISAQQPPPKNLSAMLADKNIEKLFHFARFDLAILKRHICPVAGPIFCTKIASKLARTYTDKHSLAELCRELLRLDISKQQQSSDWGAPLLSAAQKDYAAGDVLYLHQLKEHLVLMLERIGRLELARSCFDFLDTRINLDLAGFETVDIFHH